MKFLLAFLAVIAVTQAAVHFNAWNTFKTTFGKVYKNHAEEIHRMKIFLNNSYHIEVHNQKFKQGLVSYTKTINKFADLTHAEFIKFYGGFNRPANATGSHLQFVARENFTLADSVDWRQKGAVTGVKDQAQCGSCWAFSAVGSLEGQHFLSIGQLVSLSEQNLVDCSGDYGNDGCGGGWMDQAFDYVKANGGIDTEESYPYEAVDDTCRYKDSSVGAKINGYVDIQKNDEQALQQAIASVGPISIAIDASDNFMFYSGGILDDDECDPEYLNHGVLAVGYGSENGQDYYIVKNSWGGDWGEQGYIRMSRNKNNQCGVASVASYPNVVA